MIHRSFQALVVVCLALVPALARAERLPIRAYTTADGLPHNTINRIVRDSRGFLWFATNDGLSRFDGYAFTNFGTAHGLPHPTVTDLLETKDGEFWVATHGGLVRFRPHGVPHDAAAAGKWPPATPMFAVIAPPDHDPRAKVVIALMASRDGTIWCGTKYGLYKLTPDRRALQQVDVGLSDEHPEGRHVTDLVEDLDGTMWLATPRGVYARHPEGHAASYSARSGLPDDYIHDLMLDRRGHLWLATRHSSFFRAAGGAGAHTGGTAVHFSYPNRFITPWVSRLLESSDGRFWAATQVGLVEFPAAPIDGSQFRVYTRANGLSHQQLTTLAEDGSGNLWIGTATNGAMKLARGGFVTYGQPDGLASASAIVEDSTGQLYVQAAVLTTPPSPAGGAGARPQIPVQRFGRFDGRVFEWFSPAPPFGWSPDAAASAARTRGGEWWLAGTAGVFRYGPLASLGEIATAEPIKVFTPEDGLPSPLADRIFADSDENVWFSVISPPAHALFRWEPATGALRDMSAAPGYPVGREELPRSFGEDTAGNVWIGMDSRVVRYNRHGFTLFTTQDGLPPGSIAAIHADDTGRLWLASSQGGLIRVDRPGADRPTFTTYSTAQGMSGSRVEAITSDRYGRIYAATGTGIDQLHVETGRVKHFTVDDGLAPGTVVAAFRDRTGTLWFGTQNGLSRFTPPAPEHPAPPAVMIIGLRIAGESHAVSAVGETEMVLPDLRSHRDQLQIDFVSLRFAPGGGLRYQYRLDGSDKNWSPPTPDRSASYSSLSPGRYRFRVRALNADGVLSSVPAVVRFTVLAPVWQRWWFLSLAVLAGAAVLVAAHRYTLSRALARERMRTRIATTLHNDIGPIRGRRR